jgi:hypothetical protein
MSADRSADRAPPDRRGRSRLLDAAIVAVVATVILGAAVVHGANRSGDGSGILRSNLFARLDKGLRSLAADFERADFDAPSATGDSLAYQLPISGGGAAAKPDPAVPTDWGIVANGVPMRGGRATLRFVADSLLDESQLAVDLNGDGDQRDKFEQGHLERLLPDGAIEQLTGAWILQPAGDHGADVDGDGKVDPIFALDVNGPATIARLSLVVALPVGGGSFLVERIDRSFPCPNDRP